MGQGTRVYVGQDWNFNTYTMNKNQTDALLAWMKQVTNNLVLRNSAVALPELRAFEEALGEKLEGELKRGESSHDLCGSVPVVDPGEGWRLLEAVELPRKGDSWTSPHVVGWHQLADDEDGFRCPDISYRRRGQTEKQATPAPEPHKNQGEL